MNNFENERKSTIAKAVGKKIYALRTHQKYSREFLAEKVNLSANYIYEIEHGNYTLGCVPIIDICNALKITPTELLSDFVELPKSVLSETLISELDKLSEKDCKIVLTLIKMLKE